MALLGLSPSLPVAAENIRHLQGWPHGDQSLFGIQFLQWADHFAQHLGGDMGIACSRFQLLVPEQDLDNPDIKLLFQQMGGKTVPLMPSSALTL